MEVIYGLCEEGSYEVNKLNGKGENIFNQKIDLQSRNIDIGW